MDSLKKEDFAVREDGVAKTIEPFQPRTNCRSMCSRAGPERFDWPLSWAPCATRRRPRLARSSPKTQWRCSLFPLKPNCANRSAKTKTKLPRKSARFQAGGATNINDGIFVAAEYLLKLAPKGRRVIILISDRCRHGRGRAKGRAIS